VITFVKVPVVDPPPGDVVGASIVFTPSRSISKWIGVVIVPFVQVGSSTWPGSATTSVSVPCVVVSLVDGCTSKSAGTKHTDAF
jgi:hypothetical protein